MEEYSIVLESQLGPREGTLRLQEDKAGGVTGAVVLLGVENPAVGEWTDAHSLRISHHLRTRVSDLECVSELEIRDGKLSGTLTNAGNTMLWHGERAGKTEEEGKGNAGE